MNSFDFEIITWLNQFSQHSWTFDKTMVFIAYNNLLKAFVLIAIMWWAWFKSGERCEHNREYILITLFSTIFAIAAARALAFMLPFRFRPLHTDSLHFLIPEGELRMALEGWSSFPSDHAVMFFTLATGLFFVSKRMGIFACAYTTLFIAFPRVYLGIHYPTDIIAGTVLGVAIALIANIYFVKNKYIQLIVKWSYTLPEYFYPVFFLVTYQITDMFDDSRALAEAGLTLFKNIVG